MDLPILTNSSCRLLSACGRVAADDKPALPLIAQLATRGRLIAEYGDAAAPHTVILWGGGKTPKLERHVHIDVVRSDFFQRPPKVNASLQELQEAVAPLGGQSIEVRGTARYVISMTALPERGFILGTRLQAESQDFAIRQTGAVFSFTRGPVERLEWSASEEPNAVDIALDSNMFSTINEIYLSVLFRAFESAFQLLVMGGNADGTR